jgi:hypothetical protein
VNYAQKPKQGAWSEHVVPDVPGITDTQARYSGGVRKNILAAVVKAWERRITPEPDWISAQEMQPLGETHASAGPATTGVFEADWHTKNLIVDVQPFHYLYDRLGPESAIESVVTPGSTFTSSVNTASNTWLAWKVSYPNGHSSGGKNIWCMI